MANRRLVLVVLALCLHGCGVLYTHTTEPLTTNFDRTPGGYGQKTANGDTKEIHLTLEARWDTNGIGEIAKKNGISEIYYADIETLSVLFGIWEQDYVHIYGK